MALLQNTAPQTHANTPLQSLRDYALLTLGSLIMSIGISFFKFPNHFSYGGVSGLAIILNRCLPMLSQGTYNTVLNVVLLAIGFLIFGRSFGIRSTYCTLIVTAFVQLFEFLCPLQSPMTTQPVLELIFAVGLPAVGSAIMFNLDASSGGTDIIAMVFRRYTSVNIGNALFISDVLIAASACIVFNMETGLFSLIGLGAKSLMLDSVMDAFRRRKCVRVITDDPNPITDFIVKTLHRSATLSEVQGAYTHEGKCSILTVLTRSQALALRKYIRETDPHAFIIITDSTEIIGKGFARD